MNLIKRCILNYICIYYMGNNSSRVNLSDDFSKLLKMKRDLDKLGKPLEKCRKKKCNEYPKYSKEALSCVRKECKKEYKALQLKLNEYDKKNKLIKKKKTKKKKIKSKKKTLKN